jgi:putative DNA primase/helicase
MSNNELWESIEPHLSKLKQVGADKFMSLCVFHEETNPSLSIDVAKGVYHCFGCEAAGTLRELADKLNHSTPSELSESLPESSEQAVLVNSADAMARLMADRFLLPETIDHFKTSFDEQKQAWKYPADYKDENSLSRYKNIDRKALNKYWSDKGIKNRLYGIEDIPVGTSEVLCLNGEPAVWAAWQDRLHALCCFGEGGFPDDGIEELRQLNPGEIIIIADNDETGFRDANKRLKLLKEAGFTARAVKLPPELGEHSDFADLHTSCEGEVEPIEKALSQLKELEPINEPMDTSKYFGKSITGKYGFQPVLLAKEILNENSFVSLLDEKVYHLFHYQDGVYRRGGYGFVRNECLKKLGDEDRMERFRNAVSYIEGAVWREREEFNTNPDILNVRNGLLNIKNRELTPHSPNYLSFIQLPVKLKPDADCPGIKKFLSEVAKEEDMLTIQEYLGNCLLRHNKYARAIVLVGSGRNGKSTLLALIKAFLGADNVSNHTLQAICEDRFALAGLHNKLANISSELPSKALVETGKAKSVIAGDNLEAEEKFGTPFSFQPYCKLIFSTNQLPQTSDKSKAFYWRWIILHFDKYFPPDSPNTKPNILNELTTEEELSGLLNWALDGLRRLEANNGRFSYNADAEAIERDWERNSNPIQAFVEEQCEIESDNSVSKNELYECYLEFCKANHFKSANDVHFARALSRMYKHEIFTEREVTGERRRIWRGIKIC